MIPCVPFNKSPIHFKQMKRNPYNCCGSFAHPYSVPFRLNFTKGFKKQWLWFPQFVDGNIEWARDLGTMCSMAFCRNHAWNYCTDLTATAFSFSTPFASPRLYPHALSSSLVASSETHSGSPLSIAWRPHGIHGMVCPLPTSAHSIGTTYPSIQSHWCSNMTSTFIPL